MPTEAKQEKDGKPLRIRKGTIKDETGSTEIVLYSSLVDKVSNNTHYDFKKMIVQKFINDRTLNSTETTKVSKNDDVAIFVTKEELSAFSYEKTVKAKVVSTDLKTLTQIYLCPTCSAPVSINNAIAWCERFIAKSMQVESRCEDGNIGSGWSVKIYHRCTTRFNRKIHQFGCFKTPKKDIIMKLIDKSFSFTLNKINKCLDMCQ